jgi:hypothetical protein
LWYNIIVIKGNGNSNCGTNCPHEKFFKKLFKNPLTKPQTCGIIYMSKGESVRLSQRPKSNLFYKKEGKPL